MCCKENKWVGQCGQSKVRLLQLQIQALQVTECGYKNSSSKVIMPKTLKWGMFKEYIERRHGEPFKFLFLPKMGLLGSQAELEKKVQFWIMSNFLACQLYNLGP